MPHKNLEARKAWSKAYYRKNKTTILEKKNAKYANDPKYRETIRIQCQKYALAHREERHIRVKQKYQTDLEFKASNLARGRRWRAENQDKIRAYNNTPTGKKLRAEASVRSLRKRRINLDDSYIKTLLVTKTRLSFSDIPPELVEAKRAHIKLIRKIKELS